MTIKYMNGQAELGVAPAGAQKAVRRPKRKRASTPLPNGYAPPAQPSAAHGSLREWWHSNRIKLGFDGVKWLLGALALMAGAGWIILPAKQSDLNALAIEIRQGFVAIDQRFNQVGQRMEALLRDQQAFAQEMIRIRTIQEVRDASASVPAAPSPRPRRAAPAKEPAKQSGFFNF